MNDPLVHYHRFDGSKVKPTVVVLGWRAFGCNFIMSWSPSASLIAPQVFWSIAIHDYPSPKDSISSFEMCLGYRSKRNSRSRSVQFHQLLVDSIQEISVRGLESHQVRIVRRRPRTFQLNSVLHSPSVWLFVFEHPQSLISHRDLLKELHELLPHFYCRILQFARRVPTPFFRLAAARWIETAGINDGS